jgi:hypothetical protein
MKQLTPDDRPREKLLKNGPAALGDTGGGRRAGRWTPRGRRVTSPTNYCTRADYGLVRRRRRLAFINGIGDAKAAQVLAALELGGER